MISNLTQRLRSLLAAPPLHGLGGGSPSDTPAASSLWPAFFLLLLTLGLGYYVLIFSKALVELELETDSRTLLKFYLPDAQGHYSEQRTAKIQIKPGRTNYAVRTADLDGIARLRLDPSENKSAVIRIRRISVQQSGYPSLLMASKADFAQLRVVSGVQAAERPDEGGIRLEIQEDDPQLELDLPGMERRPVWNDLPGPVIGIVLLALAGAGAGRALGQGLGFAPVLAVFALALSVAMAGISGVNTHPDESVHIAAAAYYQEHVLPPRADDPAVGPTCSIYGVSRLHYAEVYYWLAGNCLRLLAPLQLESYLTLRLLNLLLFLSLTLYAFRQAEFRPFLLPLLISPQIWYVFSYANSDAFAVFISLLAAWQIAGERSAFNTLLHEEAGWRGWLAAVLLFGLLPLLKKNFHFASFFLLACFFWRLWAARPQLARGTAFRLAVLLLLGGSLAFAWRFTDAWVNNFKKGELMRAAKEQYANYAYKPSTPLAEKNSCLYLRDRGKPLRALIEVDRWGEKTFRSAVGVFGYTQYSAPALYYNAVRGLGLLLLLTLLVPLLLRGGLPGIALTGLFSGCAVLLPAMMLYKSWTMDFQPQGRYLLPLVPMLAVLCYHGQRLLPKPWLHSLLVLLFLLSVYTFVGVGLLEIGRAVSL